MVNHIILTCGKDHQIIAHTTVVLERPDISKAYGACYKDAGWNVEFDAHRFWERDSDNRFIQAWIYDEAQRKMIHLYPLPNLGKEVK